MTFTLEPETQKITFGVVSDLTNDAISIPLADQFGVSELFRDRFIYASQALADVAWVPNDSAKMRANIGTEVLDFNAVLDSTVGSIDTDASLPASASFDNFTDYALSTGVKYYVEIKRTASNSYAIGLFSDPEYTVSIVSATGTCPVGVTGLRYIKIMNQTTV